MSYVVHNQLTREILTGLSRSSGVVLEKVCEYFCYNEKHKDQTNVADMDIPPELCLELLMAADYLDT
jgi:transcription elongation factor B subunit 1